MTDPRENKLPKWAQELLHEERLKSALTWPCDERPHPDFVAGRRTGRWLDLKPKAGALIYSVNDAGIFSYVVLVNGKVALPAGVSVQRPSGYYFENIDDARLEYAYIIAREAAHKLLDAKTLEPRN